MKSYIWSLALIMFLSSGQELSAQSFVGIQAGFHIPGAQDLKFKRFDEQLVLRETIHTNRVSSNISSFNGISLTIFGNKNFWEDKGLKFEMINWEFDSRAKGFFVKDAPPLNYAEQHRMAIFASMIRKFDPPAFIEHAGISDSYIFVGMGGGPVLTDIDPGKYEWNLGFQVLGGLGVPLGNRFLGTLEAKYVITHDADNNITVQPGWLVDTSGTSSWLRFGPHLDTRFLTIQVGIQWLVLK